MSRSSSYLVKRFKDLGFRIIVFKNLYVTKDGKTIWFEEDLKPGIQVAKTTIFGLMSYGEYTKFISCSGLETFRFSYQWNTCGTFYIPIDAFTNEAFDSFADSLITQMLLKVKNGKNIYVGNELLFKKNTAYEVLVDIDVNF